MGKELFTLACRDFGVDCSWEGGAENTADAKKWADQHVRAEHTDFLEGMSEDQLADLDGEMSRRMKEWVPK